MELPAVTAVESHPTFQATLLDGTAHQFDARSAVVSIGDGGGGVVTCGPQSTSVREDVLTLLARRSRALVGDDLMGLITR